MIDTKQKSRQLAQAQVDNHKKMLGIELYPPL
jgi:hypothetical protein